jgi:hypothetical protein
MTRIITMQNQRLLKIANIKIYFYIIFEQIETIFKKYANFKVIGKVYILVLVVSYFIKRTPVSLVSTVVAPPTVRLYDRWHLNLLRASVSRIIIVCCFTSRSRILQLYGYVTITCEGLQNLGLCTGIKPVPIRNPS